MESILGLNLFDLGAAALLLLMLLYGAWRGMARLLLGFIGLAAAWVVATRYSEALAQRWGAGSSKADSLQGAPEFIHVAAFAFLFLAVAVAASIVGWLVARALGAVKLAWLDRCLGAGLGLLVAILLICALSVPLVAMLPPDGGPVLRASFFAPYAVAGGEWMAPLAPDGMRKRFLAVASAFRDPDRGAPAPPPAPPGPNAPKAEPAPRRH